VSNESQSELVWKEIIRIRDKAQQAVNALFEDTSQTYLTRRVEGFLKVISPFLSSKYISTDLILDMVSVNPDTLQIYWKFTPGQLLRMYHYFVQVNAHAFLN